MEIATSWRSIDSCARTELRCSLSCCIICVASSHRFAGEESSFVLLKNLDFLLKNLKFLYTSHLTRPSGRVLVHLIGLS